MLDISTSINNILQDSLKKLKLMKILLILVFAASVIIPVTVVMTMKEPTPGPPKGSD